MEEFFIKTPLKAGCLRGVDPIRGVVITLLNNNGQKASKGNISEREAPPLEGTSPLLLLGAYAQFVLNNVQCTYIVNSLFFNWSKINHKSTPVKYVLLVEKRLK